MSAARIRQLRYLFAVLACALLASTVGGCGSSGSSGSNLDPATVVPASAPLYLSAIVQPNGSLKSDAVSAAQRITHRKSPFAALLQTLAASGGPTPNFDRDIKPWLGDRAAIFTSPLASGESDASAHDGFTQRLAEALSKSGLGVLGAKSVQDLLSASLPQGALVLDTTDVGKARAFIDARVQGPGAHSVSYRGITYRTDSSGSAAAIVGEFAVLGSEVAVKSAIDTHAGSGSLARAADYAKLAATSEPGALAELYLEPAQLQRTSESSATGGPLLPLLGQVLGGPAYLSLIPAANTLTLDLDTLASSARPSGSGTTGAQAIGGLPGSAWLAAGLGSLKGTFGSSTGGLSALASLLGGFNLGSISFKQALAPLTSHAFNVHRDLLSWAGSAAVFAGGSGLLNLQAGIVISSTNPALSRAAVGELSAAYRAAGGTVSPTSIPGTEAAATVKLPDFPLVLTIGDGQGRFVIGLGPASVQEALAPQSTLSEAQSYHSAAAGLGHGLQPSVLVDVPTLLSLADSIGLNQDSGTSELLGYLQSLTTITAGAGETLPGGVRRSRMIIGLQQAG